MRGVPHAMKVPVGVRRLQHVRQDQGGSQAMSQVNGAHQGIQGGSGEIDRCKNPPDLDRFRLGELAWARGCTGQRHREHRARTIRRDGVGCGSQQPIADMLMALQAHHDEIHIELPRRGEDVIPWVSP